MTRLLLAAVLAKTLVLGTIPPYPGATRPLPHLENSKRAIALTSDKPERVAVYYFHGLTAAGWTPAPEAPQEVLAAKLGQPAWLTFTRKPGLRVDLQITQGTHPKTRKPVTMIIYEAAEMPPESEQ